MNANGSLRPSNILRRWPVALSALGISLSACVSAMAQPAYSISELNSTQGNCAPMSINDGGNVAGICNNIATLWLNGFVQTLQKLPKGASSTAGSLNASGVAVGWGDLGDGRPHAVMYRNGGIINIDPAAANSYGIYINDIGVVVGNALKGFGGCNSWVAGIYVEDTSKPGTFRRTDLQPYPGGDGNVRCEWATAANQSLQVVGWVQNSLFGQRGAFWNNDSKHTLALLQPFGDDWSSLANGVNDLGQAVGESHPGVGDILNRPVVWNNDASHTPINLPMLAGDNYGTAAAVNKVGQIIGVSGFATTTGGLKLGPSNTRYVIWRDGGVFELQSLLDATSGAGWTITGITGINNNGQIVGSGTHNGLSTLFVMTPTVQ